MRGGKHPKSSFKTGYQALLDAIWTKFGGYLSIAEKLGVDPQTLRNWRLRGRVPLKECYQVALALGIPIWGLNYKEVTHFHAKEAIPWETVVKMYNFSPGIEKRILKLPI